jgi:hypothetical protein
VFHLTVFAFADLKPPSFSLSQRLLHNRFPVEKNYADHLPLSAKNSNSAHYGSSVGGNTENVKSPVFSNEKTFPCRVYTMGMIGKIPGLSLAILPCRAGD